MEADDTNQPSGTSRTKKHCSSSSATLSPKRISADMERRSHLSSDVGRPDPPTPPGSPIDRPFPPAMIPPPISMEDASSRLEARRVGGDGGRHKSESRSSGNRSIAHQAGKTHKSKGGATGSIRQPSDGYQVLDETHHSDSNSADNDAQDFNAAAATSKYRTSSTASTAAQIISSDSGESSSECDWSEDGVDSSDDHSEQEVQAPRGAADGMSSDADVECLL